MSPYKYTRVPSEDIAMTNKGNTETTFDFSSAFSYDDSMEYSKPNSFKSVFTYRNTKQIRHNELDDTVHPSVYAKCCYVVINLLCYLGLFLTFPVSAWFVFKRSKDYESVVIFRLGKLLAVKDPGIFFVIPCLDKWVKVDTRMRAFSVPPQRMFTIDGAVIEVGADVYFSITDVLSSVINVQDMNHSLRVLAQTTIQNHLTHVELSDIEKNKNYMNEHLQKHVSATSINWGVRISRVDISQVKVLQEPVHSTFMQGNPLEALGPVLYPPGTNHPPGKLDFKDLLSMMMPQMAAQMTGKQNDHQQREAVETIVDIESEAGMQPSQHLTARSLIQAVQQILTKQLVHSFMTVYQFIIHGEEGGVFYLDLKNGSGAAGEGDPPGGEVDVLISLSSSDLDKMLRGELDVVNAYFSGRLRFKGNLSAARQLENLVDKLKPVLQRT